MGIGSHQLPVMSTDTWLTPPHLVGVLGEFDLDPCAAPTPRPWPTATTHLCLPDDGLALVWHGRVWLNPPYSRNVHAWMSRMAAHGHGTALVFARTETAWFQDTVCAAATAVLFLAERLHFHHGDGSRAANNAGAPSCLVAYGHSDAGRLLGSGLAGSFMLLQPTISPHPASTRPGAHGRPDWTSAAATARSGDDQLALAVATDSPAVPA